jgi:hypothetical protein
MLRQYIFLNIILVFEVLCAMTMKSAVLQNVTPCSVVARFQRFGQVYWLLLQGRNIYRKVAVFITTVAGNLMFFYVIGALKDFIKSAWKDNW